MFFMLVLVNPIEYFVIYWFLVCIYFRGINSKNIGRGKECRILVVMNDDELYVEILTEDEDE